MVNEFKTPPDGDVKNRIDKTSEYAARYGDSFETKVLNKEKDNPLFNFMKKGDIYYDYYKFKIQEKKAEKLKQQQEKEAAEKASAANKESANTSTSSPTLAAPAATSTAATVSPTTTTTTTTTPLPQPPTIPTPPPEPKKEIYEPEPLLYILDIPETMSSLELDTIRLTAQFVAKNGQSFLTELSAREAKNTQFDFLKPTSHLYEWFRALVESYVAVIYPPKNIKSTLSSTNFNDKQTILERAINRFEYNQEQENAKKKAEEEEDKEKALIASIDWHDFVIVDTIDFYDEDLDLLPQPKTFEQLISSDLSLANEEDGNNDEEMDVEMETEMETEDMEDGDNDVGAPVQQSKLKIVKDYVKNKAATSTSAAVHRKLTQICQICNQEIPLEEMGEHMRIELIRKNQKERLGNNSNNSTQSTLVEDDEIAKNLQSFASKRSDIFGEDEELKRKEQNRQQSEAPKIIWDGHTNSITRTQQAVHQQQQKIQQQKIQQQQQQQNQQQQQQHPHHQQHHQPPPPPMGFPQQPIIPNQPGLFYPPPPPPMGFGQQAPPPPQFIPGMPQPPPPYNIPGMVAPPGIAMGPPIMQQDMDEPAQKKQKKDDNLIPELLFIQQNPGPVNLMIELSEGDGKASKVFPVTVQLVDLIQTLKEKIKDATGMAPNKQKLKTAGISVLKDQCTVAFYNLKSGSTVSVGLKERGGRKK
ncbi:hypothetical protein CYY_003371 [Polysphondylium violaceum]|uniref:SWAP/Surp domain-containing protein n=1 Tax=Polysphondylium violaceum TaxID=133409 RepID=A0A8J4PZM2_9MYCE|nr:hypothetical protein CYY_003371 [Polysphondylium violaceum]